MKRGVVAGGVFASAFLLISSCAGPVPPIPAPPLSGADPEVRDAIMMTYRAAVAAPASGQAAGRFGMVLHAHALYPQAIVAYQRAIRLEPDEFAWRYFSGLVLEKLSRRQEALDALSAALKIRPGYAPAILKQAEIQFQLGKFDKSRAIYESLLEHDPSSALALYGLAQVKYAKHDLSAAEDLYRRACQAYPTFGAAYFGLGTADRSLGRVDEATRNFELAQRYLGDSPPPEDPEWSRVRELATGVAKELDQEADLIKHGRLDEAAKLNEQLLARDPENFTFLVNALYLSRLVDRFDDRLEMLYAKATRINPQVAYIYSYYGSAKARQGKYDAATASLRKAIALKPDDADAHRWLAEVLEKQNRPAEATEHYQRALAADPLDRALQLELWRNMIVLGRAREAIPQLIPALNVQDTYTSYALILAAEAYRTTGEPGKARQYLERARSRVSTEGPPEMLAEIERELKALPARTC